jgi:hypothetical protein
MCEYGEKAAYLFPSRKVSKRDKNIMKILSLAVAFVLLTLGNASAQSRFVPDSISIQYSQCKGERATTQALLINRGSSLEILDLRFADSNRTWEIYDSTGGTNFIKGVLLYGGDTLKFNLRQKPQSTGLTHEWYRDTLVTSGAATSDTLLLNAKIQFAELQTDLDSVDFGVLPQGAVAMQIFRVWNVGDAPHIFSFTASPEWKLQGIANGDTLAPGDTVTAHFILPGTTPIGTYTPFLSITGDCDDLGIFRGTRVKIAPEFAHFTVPRFVDTTSGCVAGETYQVTIRNDSPTNTIVDSIQILGQAQQWSIPNVDDRTFIIAPHSNKTIVLARNATATSTRLVIHTNNSANDTLPITVVPMFSQPRIKNAVDTAKLDLKPSEPGVYSIDIQNQGAGLYRLTDVQLEGDPRWSVLGLDTITTTGLNKSILIKLVFSGASEPGSYPVKAFIRGTPCDTLMTQVVVARVAVLGVAERLMQNDVYVSSTVTSSKLTLRSGRRVQFVLYNSSGMAITFGWVEGEYEIDISSLPSGQYFLGVKSNENSRTIAIAIVR